MNSDFSTYITLIIVGIILFFLLINEIYNPEKLKKKDNGTYEWVSALEEKLLELTMEIASIQKNIIIYPSENNYKNLHISKTKELNSLYAELKQEKGENYLNDFVKKLSNKYGESKYVLSKTEQKILDKILTEYKIEEESKITKFKDQKVLKNSYGEEFNLLKGGFWNGQKGLALTFWVFFVGGNILFNTVTLIFADNSTVIMINLIFFIIWNVLAVMGVFNAANIYKAEKMRRGLPYTAATIAKVAVVLLILSAIGNNIPR
jgi:hypothetical protein